LNCSFCLKYLIYIWTAWRYEINYISWEFKLITWFWWFIYLIIHQLLLFFIIINFKGILFVKIFLYCWCWNNGFLVFLVRVPFWYLRSLQTYLTFEVLIVFCILWFVHYLCFNFCLLKSAFTFTTITLIANAFSFIRKLTFKMIEIDLIVLNKII
jgi:hypothetical protein